jgi:hypothetical protein
VTLASRDPARLITGRVTIKTTNNSRRRSQPSAATKRFHRTEAAGDRRAARGGRRPGGKVEEGMVGFVNVKTDYRARATTVRFSSRET